MPTALKSCCQVARVGWRFDRLFRYSKVCLLDRLFRSEQLTPLGTCNDTQDFSARPTLSLRAWDLDRYAKVCLLDTDTEPRQRSSSIRLEAPWKRRAPERNGMESCQCAGERFSLVWRWNRKTQKEAESRAALHPQFAIGSMRWVHAILGIVRQPLGILIKRNLNGRIDHIQLIISSMCQYLCWSETGRRSATL